VLLRADGPSTIRLMLAVTIVAIGLPRRHSHFLPNIIAALQGIIVGERVNVETIWGIRINKHSQRSILRFVSGSGHQGGTTDDLPAHDPSNCLDIHHRCTTAPESMAANCCASRKADTALP
jgi:hypothetical protein